MNSLFKIDYNEKDMILDCIYKNEKAKKGKSKFKSNKIEKIYGELLFDNKEEDRPYIFTSLVHSIDGRIAFSDAPEGPFIASKNKYDTVGGTIDFWILNILRSQCDGCIMGANTLKAEEHYTVHIFDKDIEKDRENSGLNDVPWNIITSVDGQDIPFDHIIFNTKEVPKIINTSVKGLDFIKENFKKDFIVLPNILNKEDLKKLENIELNIEQIYILATDNNGYPDTNLYLKALKKLGFYNLLVESPTLMHIFIENKVMDELFFNYSCLYIGGKALTMGQIGKEFTSTEHPHTEVLSVHMHSPHFMYFRHKLIYN